MGRNGCFRIHSVKWIGGKTGKGPGNEIPTNTGPSACHPLSLLYSSHPWFSATRNFFHLLKQRCIWVGGMGGRGTPVGPEHLSSKSSACSDHGEWRESWRVAHNPARLWLHLWYEGAACLCTLPLPQCVQCCGFPSLLPFILNKSYTLGLCLTSLPVGSLPLSPPT